MSAAVQQAEAARPSPMVVAAAREMCRQQADECGIDKDDLWKVYGEEFQACVELILQTAGVPQMVAFAQSFLLAATGATAGSLVLDRASPLVGAARDIVTQATGNQP
jgi:hypothetical protein